jgi:hypothetical protein
MSRGHHSCISAADSYGYGTTVGLFCSIMFLLFSGVMTVEHYDVLVYGANAAGVRCPWSLPLVILDLHCH